MSSPRGFRRLRAAGSFLYNLGGFCRSFSVGAATWGHSVRSVRPGGTIAICGATTGDQPGAELTRIFFQDIRVQGCTMGSREDFARLLRFVEHADLHPVIDSVVSGLDAAPEAFARMIAGDMFGKIVIEL